MFCSQPYSSLLVKICCCTIPSGREKGRKETPQGRGPAGQPRALCPSLCLEMVPAPLPSCLRLCPTPTFQGLQPAGHSNAGEMEIFPGRERRQEPINLSVSWPYQCFFTLQEYFSHWLLSLRKSLFQAQCGGCWCQCKVLWGSLQAPVQPVQAPV